MDVTQRERGTYVFGPFRLDPVRRTLHRDGNAVSLTSRLFDTLLYLVHNPERLVTRDELESVVWRGRPVEDGNLQKAVSALRRVLNADDPTGNLIVTVTGRGYQFAIPVEFEPSQPEIGPIDAMVPLGSAETAKSVASTAWRGRRALALGSAALLLAAIGLWWIGSRRAPGPQPFTPPPHSVAVMAFTNLSGDAGQDYFSDGLSEELIDALGRVGAMRVAARLSSFSFKGKPTPVGEIARALNVGTVLEGSMRRDGPRLRVTAQLIDGATGFQIWSNHYDSDHGDILQVQDQIAQAVAASLQVTLLGTDMTKLTLGGTTTPAAFDAYLRGIGLANQKSGKAIKQAALEFEAALKLDPDYVLALVQHAKMLIAIVESYSGSDMALVQKNRAEALGEARRAVALAPGLGVAHTVLAAALDETWDFVEADVEYARGKELAPGDAWVSWLYAAMLSGTGHVAESLAAARLSVELDPLSPAAYRHLAASLTQARHFDEARSALRHAEDLGFSGQADTGARAMIDLREGNFVQARKTCAGAENVMQIFCLALADHALGLQAQADADLAKLRASEGDDAAYMYADIYAQWGRFDDALQWLETAYRLHDDGLIDLKWDSFLDPIRGMPRFEAVKRNMHFAE
jgi:serine/threonine-protein kinase